MFNTKISEQKIKEVLNAINDRDLKDDQIDKINKTELLDAGLNLMESIETIEINTGEIVGIENVISVIKSHINENIHIIALEGKSGVGKSTTTKKLSQELKSPILSMGDIFRYITVLQLEDGKIPADIFDRLHYQKHEGEIKLFDLECNITETFGHKLRKPEVEKGLPNVAKHHQKDVIEFCQKEILKIREAKSNRILLEGRSFTLDFLPADLRIVLYADPLVRAERRARDLESGITEW